MALRSVFQLAAAAAKKNRGLSAELILQINEYRERALAQSMFLFDDESV